MLTADTAREKTYSQTDTHTHTHTHTQTNPPAHARGLTIAPADNKSNRMGEEEEEKEEKVCPLQLINLNYLQLFAIINRNYKSDLFA